MRELRHERQTKRSGGRLLPFRPTHSKEAHLRILAALLLLPLTACGNGGGPGAGEPPDPGFPWLAERYDVEVEVVAAACALGGYTPVPADGVASVRQDRQAVTWSHRSSAVDTRWDLYGEICAAGDGFALHLRGGEPGSSRFGERTCRVLARIPANGSNVAAPARCGDDDAVVLALDPCGTLEGELDLGLEIGVGTGEGDCVHDTPCTVRLRWRATPTRLNPAAPQDAGPPECL